MSILYLVCKHSRAGFVSNSKYLAAIDIGCSSIIANALYNTPQNTDLCSLEIEGYVKLHSIDAYIHCVPTNTVQAT